MKLDFLPGYKTYGVVASLLVYTVICALNGVEADMNVIAAHLGIGGATAKMGIDRAKK